MYEAVVPGPGAGGGEAAQVLCRILGLVRPGDLVLLGVSNGDIDVQHYTLYLEEAPSPCWKCLLKVLWTTRVKSPNVLADRLVYDEFLLIVSESVKVLEDLS